MQNMGLGMTTTVMLVTKVQTPAEDYDDDDNDDADEGVGGDED